MSYTFTHSTEDGDEVKLVTHHVCWRDVADNFYYYLLGCGFVLSRQDLSDHFNEEGFGDAK